MSAVFIITAVIELMKILELYLFFGKDDDKNITLDIEYYMTIENFFMSEIH